MNKFLSQNKDALTKKKRRWKPKGRQVDDSSYKEIVLLLAGIEIVRDELIEYIHLIQDNFGCLYDKHLTALAEFMKIPLAEVYEVATFYAHFNVVKDSNIKAPKVAIRVCESLTCEMFGSKDILKDFGAHYENRLYELFSKLNMMSSIYPNFYFFDGILHLSDLFDKGIDKNYQIQ